MGIYTAIVKAGAQSPQKTAVVFNERKLAYAELLELVDRAVAALQVLAPGCRRIAVNAHNSPELLAMALAISKLGLTMVPLNPALRKAQLQKQIQATCCDVLVSYKASVELWREALPNIKVLAVEECFADQAVKPEYSESEPDINAAYLITLSSGSTGDPKPIVLSQQSKLLRSRQAQQCYRIQAEDVILCASPFYHSLGQRLCFLPLLHGATLVLLEHFSVDAWLKAVETHKVSFTIAVSSHLQALQAALIDAGPGLRSLRCLVSSSALLTAELKEKLFAKLGCEFHEMYGATEVATATNLSPEDARFRPGSVGRILPEVDLHILDDAGKQVASNTVGEIACKSSLVFNGYDAKPRETRAAFKGEYFLTGDLGYLDKDGFLYFVSRKKDLIITGGVNVVPKDIEAELLKLPQIVDCCVIGVEDDYFGEAICAVCVTSERQVNTEALQKQLRLDLNKVLAGFQQPRYYEFLPAIPLTGSGKPDKQALRERFGKLAQEQRVHVR